MPKKRHTYSLIIMFLCALGMNVFGEENSSTIFPDAEGYLEQLTSCQNCDDKQKALIEELQDYVQEFLHDVREDFPFHSGLTYESVKTLVQQNATHIRQREQEKPESSGIPVYANRAYHLYLYISIHEEVNSSGDGYLSFFTNGRHQFWIDMAIEDGMVKNIYLIPGNFSWMLPPIQFDGTGEHRGKWSLSPSRTQEEHK